MLWQIESMGRFYDANEGSVVYFDPNTGDTHLLSDFAAFVIQQFTDQPLDSAELTKRLAPHVDLDEASELPQQIDGILAELHDLHIVQQS